MYFNCKQSSTKRVSCKYGIKYWQLSNVSKMTLIVTSADGNASLYYHLSVGSHITVCMALVMVSTGCSLFLLNSYSDLQ